VPVIPQISQSAHFVLCFRRPNETRTPAADAGIPEVRLFFPESERDTYVD
jgi:hypothetical protein